MMIGLLAAMVFVLAVQAQAGEELRQKYDTPVAGQNTQEEITGLPDGPGQEY